MITYSTVLRAAGPDLAGGGDVVGPVDILSADLDR
jgi:hypothetical protein